MRMLGRTDQGKIRSNNEDFFAIDERLGLALLADGMGGLNAGEVASEHAVASVLEVIRRSAPGPELPDSAARGLLLESAIQDANRRVYELGQSRFDYQGMGTTLTALWTTTTDCVVGHVGDSRTYRFASNRLTQISTDHSVVQQLVDDGILSAEEARHAPNRNIVTRAVGIEPEVEVDLSFLQVARGELLLLCSDGLTDMLDDERLERACRSMAGTPDALLDQLVDAALEVGGTDNVSVVLVVP